MHLGLSAKQMIGQCPNNPQVTDFDSRSIAAYLILFLFLNFVLVLVHQSCKVTVGSIITSCSSTDRFSDKSWLFSISDFLIELKIFFTFMTPKKFYGKFDTEIFPSSAEFFNKAYLDHIFFFSLRVLAGWVRTLNGKFH